MLPIFVRRECKSLTGFIVFQKKLHMGPSYALAITLLQIYIKHTNIHYTCVCIKFIT